MNVELICLLVAMSSERQKIGKAPASHEGSLIYHYREIEEAERARLESASIQAEEDDNESHEGMQSLSPPPPYDTNEENGTTSHPPTYKRRKLMATVIEYVPSFLPDFPDREDGAEAGLDSTREADAEFERERSRRVQMGVDRKELLNETSETKQDQDARAWATLDMAPAPKRAIEDSWLSAVEFSSSTLAQQQSIEDIPEAIDDKEDSTFRSEQESSHRIFANDYLALMAEQKSVPPALLTPTGSAFASVFNQRRNLASILADPSKYVPTDTIFASIDARPSASPFQPGPSLLITPPTNTNSAPTFTPIQASGRELISTSTINNALYPACRHRIPNNALNASRYLSGGDSGEIFRRVTRTLDPIPILDERHAERVFHGVQAPKEHLSESNSYLREALEVLKIKRAEEIKIGIENGTIDEEQSQLSMSTNRDKLRVKSGTLVQTWDWMNRDYTDSVLPGKKYRSNTAGVFISTANSNDADQSFGS
jgi:hypothetical protein